MLKPLIAAFAVLAVVAGLWAFEPWRLFTSSTVDEAVPTSATTASTAPGESTPTSPGEPATTAPPPRDRVLATGDLVDAEHDTSGSVRLLGLADGRRFVRLEDLSTSDGPDLHVWLSDAPSGGEWGSYDDGQYLRLGELKATHGNQNYAVPAGADLTAYRSVVIWCDRFDVAFGTAPVSLRD